VPPPPLDVFGLYFSCGRITALTNHFFEVTFNLGRDTRGTRRYYFVFHTYCSAQIFSIIMSSSPINNNILLTTGDNVNRVSDIFLVKYLFSYLFYIFFL